MARDKTDKTDTTPVATSATTATRAEIEKAIDENLPWILEFFREFEDFPAPHVVRPLGLDLKQLLVGNRLGLSDDNARAAVERADTDPHAFDLAGYIASRYLAFGDPMPPPLRSFAAQVLSGKRQRPRQGGRPRDGDVPLRLGLLHMLLWLHHRAGIPLSANREPKKARGLNACQLVSEAMERAGQPVGRASLESILYDHAPKHAEVRALAEALGMSEQIYSKGGG